MTLPLLSGSIHCDKLETGVFPMANNGTAKKPLGVDRRSFIGISSAAFLGAGLCSGCAMFTSQATPDQSALNADVVVLNPQNVQKLAKSGGIVRVTSIDESVRIIVVRRASGDLVALDMACTHWGTDVDFDVKRQELLCSTHGSRFGLTGKVLEGPADDPLGTYRVEEVAGKITLYLRAT